MSITKNQKGKKRLCENCNTKWYDLNKLPLLCPVCKQDFEMTDNDNLNFTGLHTPKNTKVSEDNLSELDQESKDEIIDENREEDIISLEDIEEEN